MKENLYPVKFEDFRKIMKIGNYPIMYAIRPNHIHIEMPIENCIFATKKFFNSIEEEMQLGVENDRKAQIRFFIRNVLKGKSFYQFFPSDEEGLKIDEMKMYSNLVVKEALKEFEYNPTDVRTVEDDINIYIYQLDTLIYRLEKN